MDCISRKLIWPHRTEEWLRCNEENPVSVPCGKCLSCLITKRNDWSFRLQVEHRHSAGSLFVTLTYDPKHLPNDEALSKRDLQLYLKRLRKRLPGRIRYYAVGEYGSEFGRPHYHVLLFGEVSDSVARAAWCDSKGMPIGVVHIGKVTQASVCYCTKYIIQNEAFSDGRTKPFALMSRGFGIGGQYLTDEMVAWHREDDRLYCILDGVKVRMPRFYRDKVFYGAAKDRVAKASLGQAVSRQLAVDKWYRKKFGARADQVRKDEMDCLLARVPSKVSFSQTL